MNPKSILEKNLKNSIKAKQDFLENPPILEEFNDAIEALFECYSNGGKLYLAGNGGSAADSQHLAAEFVSKLAFDREALPAEALSVDTSTITAIANDYGYEFIFSRQLEANASPKDMFLAITTSGNSDNLIKALEFCKKKKIKSILLSGKEGGSSKNLADFSIIVPGDTTAEIQEIHILVGHSMCEFIEKEFFPIK
tara:strand:- start:34347 stop:34934 length:588 start_codon:yes stop_codon:yes gene_type:complete